MWIISERRGEDSSDPKGGWRRYSIGIIIFKYGKGKYFDLKNKEFSVEKKYKIKFIEPIRKRKKHIIKFKVKICDIEAILANQTILCLNILEIMLYIKE